MGSHSGLTHSHVIDARRRAVHAAHLALQHAPAVHYTEGALRWQGISKHLVAARGEFPHWGDCSAFVTWNLWNGLAHYGVHDIVNGLNWDAGWTGTLVEHGEHLEVPDRLADIVIYGPDVGRHTAMIVGRARSGPHAGKFMVISHGSEGGPYLLPVDYRGDERRYRRYI